MSASTTEPKPRLSGWCSGPNGCNSRADHAECQDRMNTGKLTWFCECTGERFGLASHTRPPENGDQ